MVKSKLVEPEEVFAVPTPSPEHVKKQLRPAILNSSLVEKTNLFTKTLFLKLCDNLELNISKYRILKLFQVKFISDSNTNIVMLRIKLSRNFLRETSDKIRNTKRTANRI